MLNVYYNNIMAKEIKKLKGTARIYDDETRGFSHFWFFGFLAKSHFVKS